MVKKIVKVILLIILAVILLFLALLLTFRFGRNADKTLQMERVEQLQASPRSVTVIPDSLLDDGLRLNQIRYLATHNSYHHQAGPLQLAVLELVEPGEAEKLKYSHLDFYRQLDIGVRSFEFDLRYYRNGNVENIHVPLVDNRGHSPSFRLSLEEMRFWSERHPLHVPVIVIMQTKDDWMFIDPGLKKWSPEALLEVDRLIAEIMGSRIITPSELTGDAASVRDAVIDEGWPELSESRGKFFFVFHESESDVFNSEYFEHEDRVSFFMDTADSPEASFILRNEADAEDITGLIKQGFIVRTRADADCLRSENKKQTAIVSGAQIVSTDYPKGYAVSGDYRLSWNELLSTIY